MFSRKNQQCGLNFIFLHKSLLLFAKTTPTEQHIVEIVTVNS